MNEPGAFGRLINAAGELIAEGPCWLDEEAGEATMEPERTPGTLQKQRGELRLQLDSGRLFPVSDKPMILRLRSWDGAPGQETPRRLFRLRILSWGTETPQDGQSTEAGTAAEGAQRPRYEETPAAN
ncbi:MAG: hypothetical protein WEB04_06255 [Dehalococcoidia bacterium]